MDALTQLLSQLWARLFNLAAVADILIVALLIYGLLSLLQGTRANQVLRGGVILLVGLFLVSTVFRLPVLGWLVNNSLPTLFLVAALIFTPELRRALEQIGHTGDIFQRPLSPQSRDSLLIMIQEVCDACVFLSNRHWGALIVIERNTGLQDLIVNGQIVNGRVSSALLTTIFMVNSELHDGAVIIHGSRLVAAHVTLPLADSYGSRHHLGHRHKAALGITEETDAIAVIVSEETGNISVANNGELLQHLTKLKLRELLTSLLQPSLLPENKRQSQTRAGWVRQRIRNGLQLDSDWQNNINHSDNAEADAGTDSNAEALKTTQDYKPNEKTKAPPLNGHGTGKSAQAEDIVQPRQPGNKQVKK